MSGRCLSLALLLPLLAIMSAARAATPLTSTVTVGPIASSPVTVVLSPLPGFAALLQGGRRPILEIEGIEGSVAATSLSIALFLNRPDAGPATPTDAPDCIGVLFLLPVRGIVRPTGHALELAQMAALDPTKPVRITLVPVAGVDGKPHETAIGIKAIYLALEP